MNTITAIKEDDFIFKSAPSEALSVIERDVKETLFVIEQWNAHILFRISQLDMFRCNSLLCDHVPTYRGSFISKIYFETLESTVSCLRAMSILYHKLTKNQASSQAQSDSGVLSQEIVIACKEAGLQLFACIELYSKILRHRVRTTFQSKNLIKKDDRIVKSLEPAIITELNSIINEPLSTKIFLRSLQKLFYRIPVSDLGVIQIQLEAAISRCENEQTYFLKLRYLHESFIPKEINARLLFRKLEEVFQLQVSAEVKLAEFLNCKSRGFSPRSRLTTWISVLDKVLIAIKGMNSLVLQLKLPFYSSVFITSPLKCSCCDANSVQTYENCKARAATSWLLLLISILQERNIYQDENITEEISQKELWEQLDTFSASLLQDRSSFTISGEFEMISSLREKRIKSQCKNCKGRIHRLKLKQKNALVQKTVYSFCLIALTAYKLWAF